MPPAAVTPGMVASLPSQLLLKGRAPRGIVTNARQVHVERQHAIDAEPEIHLLQTVEARQEHAGAHQQRQRQRELRGGEAAAEPSLPPGGRGRARLLAKRLNRGDACKAQRRHDAEGDGSGHRHQQGKSQHHGIESDLVEPRQGVAAKALQHPDAEPRQRQPSSPPSPASNRLSTSSWRTSRRRPEPSAERMANSWTRPVARDEHEVGDVDAARRAARDQRPCSSKCSGPREGATRSSCSGTATTALRRAAGPALFHRRLRAASSACAWSRLDARSKAADGGQP